MEVYSAPLVKQSMVLNMAINQRMVLWMCIAHTEAFLAILAVE